MKKILAIILSLCMLLALTACGSAVSAETVDEILAAVTDLEARVDALAAAQTALAGMDVELHVAPVDMGPVIRLDEA